MRLQYAIQVAIDSLSLGSLYALGALGIGLVFGVMRLINFAHGDLITIGAYSLIAPSAAAIPTLWIGAWPWPLLVTGVIIVVVIAALAVERVVFRPIRGADPATLLIASFSLSYFLQYTMLLMYGGRPKGIDVGSSLTKQIQFGSVAIAEIDIVTISATLALMLGLAGLMKWTSIGIQIRAATQDFRMARMLGVRANEIIAGAFAVSGMLAAVISILLISRIGALEPRLGINMALYGFVSTVVGGMGSLTGPVAGGFLVGIASGIIQAILPEGMRPTRDAFVFALVIILLLVRPEGLVRLKSSKERV
jgi:branched-chain amino acid transport system permease protein